MKLKTFNEFFDLGKDSIWTPGKVGQVVADKAKKSATAKMGIDYRMDWRQRQAVHQKIEKSAKPSDLLKHNVKKLSDDPSHSDYTVHHLKGKDGDYDTALLHHAKKGFVGLLNGTKKKDGFHVSESFISPQHRGKGLGIALYEHAATHHKGVVSDGSLTDHSQRIYGHFAKAGRVKTYHDIGYGDKISYASDHGEEVKATESVKVKRRSGRNPTVHKKLQFSSKTHENIGKSGGGVRLRIEPKPKE